MALKTLQDEMARLTESLEAIKSQGEQARIQEQGLFLAYQQTSQQVEELETLWKLQEEEKIVFPREIGKQTRKTAKSVLLQSPVTSKIWKLRLKRLSLTKCHPRTLSKLAGRASASSFA